MKIKDKKNNLEYDAFTNKKDMIKLAKLILEYLSKKEECGKETIYRIISYFYEVKLDAFDYLRYINKKNNTDFYKVTSIPTIRVITDRQSEGHGRDFSWWDQNYQRMIKVASKEFNPSKEEYTFEEIQQLIENGEIYPIYPYGEKTQKPFKYVEDKTNYLVSYQSKELEPKDEYFDFMVDDILKEIGKKSLMNIIRRFIMHLKLNSYITSDEDVKDLEEIADNLIIVFNKMNKNKIDNSPIVMVMNYLRNLPYEEFWYEEINMEQIIGVIYDLDYEKDRTICEEIQAIAAHLKEAELCYELALNCDWIDKKTMADIVIQDGNPYFNYYFASEVEGADIERHKKVILNSKRTDEYILERAKKL